MNEIDTEKPAPEANAGIEGASTENTMDQTIADTWKEISAREPVEKTAEGIEAAATAQQRARDKAGKFAKPAPAAEGGEEALATEAAGTEEGEAATEEEIAAAAAAAEKRRMPDTWRKETAAEWDKLTPVVQDEVLKREAEMRTGIKQYSDAALRAQSFDKAIEPFMATLVSQNLDPPTAVRALLTTEHQMRYGSPIEKAQVIARFVNAYGIDLSLLGAQQEQRPVDPQVAALTHQINTLTTQLNPMLQAQQAEASLNSRIEPYKHKPHFQELAGRMSELLLGNEAVDLEDAYIQARIWRDNALKTAEAKRLADLKAEKARKAKDTASLNVNGHGVLASRAPLVSMEETIRTEAKRLGFH